ncbi:putative pyruvate dehydrogenase protein x component mitochondrial precursor [Dioszegia hungarica]|uniref:Pyruvate dehydrogenase protein x component mitochondrial n=1 Tax=Dioszegia hungarica TaxID=4972 RepID=A0AA38HEW1_9TREE|nr:putative pyruvate dehydrogenase protein x component mitochondrial precursor [Dioszegia hungarica]KAI9637614.1 putative pyruvate dehydrogenase protein x component mitochondrial precursor [Dioszegia hungarica]
MRMPAMSPTMTEGGIAGWKKQEGESFAAGDVLLEMETDKATIDVEAQDDGIMGKILVQAGAQKVPVGQVIALLAEEGDDLASIEVPSDLSPPGAEAPPPKAGASAEKKAEVPKKAEASSSTPPPAKTEAPKKDHDGHKVVKHSKPLFPSVMRLLLDSSLTSAQIAKLKGTGRHGMLTKGDVLTAMGKISNPYGSAEKMSTDAMGPSGKRASESKATAPASKPVKEDPLDGPALRRLILAGMSKATQPSTPLIDHSHSSLPLSHDSFDEILSPYSSLLPPAQPRVGIPGAGELAAMEGKGAGKTDEWAGLF